MKKIIGPFVLLPKDSTEAQHWLRFVVQDDHVISVEQSIKNEQGDLVWEIQRGQEFFVLDPENGSRHLYIHQIDDHQQHTLLRRSVKTLFQTAAEIQTHGKQYVWTVPEIFTNQRGTPWKAQQALDRESLNARYPIGEFTARNIAIEKQSALRDAALNFKKQFNEEIETADWQSIREKELHYLLDEEETEIEEFPNQTESKSETEEEKEARYAKIYTQRTIFNWYQIALSCLKNCSTSKENYIKLLKLCLANGFLDMNDTRDEQRAYVDLRNQLSLHNINEELFNHLKAALSKKNLDQITFGDVQSFCVALLKKELVSLGVTKKDIDGITIILPIVQEKAIVGSLPAAQKALLYSDLNFNPGLSSEEGKKLLSDLLSIANNRMFDDDDDDDDEIVYSEMGNHLINDKTIQAMDETQLIAFYGAISALIIKNYHASVYATWELDKVANDYLAILGAQSGSTEVAAHDMDKYLSIVQRTAGEYHLERLLKKDSAEAVEFFKIFFNDLKQSVNLLTDVHSNANTFQISLRKHLPLINQLLDKKYLTESIQNSNELVKATGIFMLESRFQFLHILGVQLLINLIQNGGQLVDILRLIPIKDRLPFLQLLGEHVTTVIKDFEQLKHVLSLLLSHPDYRPSTSQSGSMAEILHSRMARDRMTEDDYRDDNKRINYFMNMVGAACNSIFQDFAQLEYVLDWLQTEESRFAVLDQLTPTLLEKIIDSDKKLKDIFLKFTFGWKLYCVLLLSRLSDQHLKTIIPDGNKLSDILSILPGGNNHRWEIVEIIGKNVIKNLDQLMKISHAIGDKNTQLLLKMLDGNQLNAFFSDGSINEKNLPFALQLYTILPEHGVCRQKIVEAVNRIIKTCDQFLIISWQINDNEKIQLIKMLDGNQLSAFTLNNDFCDLLRLIPEHNRWEIVEKIDTNLIKNLDQLMEISQLIKNHKKIQLIKMLDGNQLNAIFSDDSINEKNLPFALELYTIFPEHGVCRQKIVEAVNRIITTCDQFLKILLRINDDERIQLIKMLDGNQLNAIFSDGSINEKNLPFALELYTIFPEHGVCRQKIVEAVNRIITTCDQFLKILLQINDNERTRVIKMLNGNQLSAFILDNDFCDKLRLIPEHNRWEIVEKIDNNLIKNLDQLMKISHAIGDENTQLLLKMLGSDKLKEIICHEGQLQKALRAISMESHPLLLEVLGLDYLKELFIKQKSDFTRGFFYNMECFEFEYVLQVLPLTTAFSLIEIMPTDFLAKANFSQDLYRNYATRCFMLKENKSIYEKNVYETSWDENKSLQENVIAILKPISSNAQKILHGFFNTRGGNEVTAIIKKCHSQIDAKTFYAFLAEQLKSIDTNSDGNNATFFNRSNHPTFTGETAMRITFIRHKVGEMIRKELNDIENHEKASIKNASRPKSVRKAMIVIKHSGNRHA